MCCAVQGGQSIAGLHLLETPAAPFFPERSNQTCPQALHKVPPETKPRPQGETLLKVDAHSYTTFPETTGSKYSEL